MFNKRSFVLGLGIGIIVGAMLLQLFYMGEASQDSLQEIGEQVEQGGLPTATVAPKESATSVNPEQSKETTPANEPTADSGTGAEEQTAASSPSGEPAATPSPETTQSQGDQNPVPFVVRIEPGMSLTETAEFLQVSGAIVDSEMFINEMKASGLRVRAGYFLFEQGSLTAEQTAAIVSGTPITAEQAKRYEVINP